MFPVGDGGGEEDLCHVRSGGRPVTHVPSGDGRGEECLCHVPSGGHSLTYVPSGGWWRRGGSLACMQWGTLTDICSQWGMVEERRICVMYAVGDTHSHMFPVEDGGGEEELWHVCSGGCSVTHVPCGGWGRRGGSLPCTKWGMLSDTCPQWGRERRPNLLLFFSE